MRFGFETDSPAGHVQPEVAASREQNKTQRRAPLWAKGALVGETVWGLALLGAYSFETFETWFPQWFVKLDLPDALGSICAVLAAPVSIGGWLLVWGDNGPPYPWIESWIFNVAFGVCFYGLLGALTGILVPRILRWRRGGS